MGFLVLRQNNLRALDRMSHGETHRLASNSIECPFYLEETMKEKTRLDNARKEARIKMNYYEDHGRWTHHTHHVDGDPLNNDISNLKIVTIREHINIHRLKKIDIEPQFGKAGPEDHACQFCGRMTINFKCLCGRSRP